MATIKSYTDLSQSKKLAEILPVESADMYYQYVLPKSDKIRHNPEIGNPTNALKWYNEGYVFSGKEPITMNEFCVPCWSLASLLDVLPNNENISTNLSKGGYRISTLEYTNSWFVDYKDETDGLNNCVTSADNPVDACVAMIEKLHELKML